MEDVVTHTHTHKRLSTVREVPLWLQGGRNSAIKPDEWSDLVRSAAPKPNGANTALGGVGVHSTRCSAEFASREIINWNNKGRRSSYLIVRYSYWEGTIFLFFSFFSLWTRAPGGSAVKNLSAMQDSQARSLDRSDALEKGMATHSSILGWRIPWKGEPGRLQYTGLQRVGHDWASNTFTFGTSYALSKWSSNDPRFQEYP